MFRSLNSGVVKITDKRELMTLGPERIRVFNLVARIALESGLVVKRKNQTLSEDQERSNRAVMKPILERLDALANAK